MLIHPCQKASTATLLDLRKDHIKPLEGLLTGYGPVKNPLLRIGCFWDNVCRFG